MGIYRIKLDPEHEFQLSASLPREALDIVYANREKYTFDDKYNDFIVEVELMR